MSDYRIDKPQRQRRASSVASGEMVYQYSAPQEKTGRERFHKSSGTFRNTDSISNTDSTRGKFRKPTKNVNGEAPKGFERSKVYGKKNYGKAATEHLEKFGEEAQQRYGKQKRGKGERKYMVSSNRRLGQGVTTSPAYNKLLRL